MSDEQILRSQPYRVDYKGFTTHFYSDTIWCDNEMCGDANNCGDIDICGDSDTCGDTDM